MIAVRDEIELGRAILDEVGLSIGPDHILIDEESGVPVQFNGKNIKFSLNDPQLYIGEGDVKFDPAHNYRMITTILGMHLDKEYDGKVLSMYEDHNTENRTTSQTIKLESGNITSQYYKNRCLAICDNILQMANYDSDLSQFDDKEE